LCCESASYRLTGKNEQQSKYGEIRGKLLMRGKERRKEGKVG